MPRHTQARPAQTQDLRRGQKAAGRRERPGPAPRSLSSARRLIVGGRQRFPHPGSRVHTLGSRRKGPGAGNPAQGPAMLWGCGEEAARAVSGPADLRTAGAGHVWAPSTRPPRPPAPDRQACGTPGAPKASTSPPRRAASSASPAPAWARSAETKRPRAARATEERQRSSRPDPPQTARAVLRPRRHSSAPPGGWEAAPHQGPGRGGRAAAPLTERGELASARSLGHDPEAPCGRRGESPKAGARPEAGAGEDGNGERRPAQEGGRGVSGAGASAERRAQPARGQGRGPRAARSGRGAAGRPPPRRGGSGTGVRGRRPGGGSGRWGQGSGVAPSVTLSSTKNSKSRRKAGGKSRE